MQGLAGDNLSWMAKNLDAGGAVKAEAGAETYSSTYPIYLAELKDSAINPRPQVAATEFQSVGSKSATFTVYFLISAQLGGCGVLDSLHCQVLPLN